MISNDENVYGVSGLKYSKRCALLFPRVIIPVSWSTFLHLGGSHNGPPKGFPAYVDIYSFESFDEYFGKKWTEFERIESASNHLSRRWPANIVPIYTDRNQFASQVIHGDDVVFQAAFNNIRVVVEDNLSWEQITSFREDNDAKIKYRDFRLWTRAITEVSSIQELTDIVSKKIENYEWAIRKHAFESAIGTLEIFTDPKKVAAFGGLVTGAGLLGGISLAAIISGLLVASEVVFSVSKAMIKMKDIRVGENSEVALLHEINRKIV